GGSAAGASQVVGISAAVANPVGMIGSVIGAYEGAHMIHGGTTSQQAIGAGQLVGNLGETGRAGAQTGVAAMHLGAAGSVAAATLAAGGLGVAGGAAFLAQGAAGIYSHEKRRSALAQQQARL